jgi:Rieske Fe-S protein
VHEAEHDATPGRRTPRRSLLCAAAGAATAPALSACTSDDDSTPEVATPQAQTPKVSSPPAVKLTTTADVPVGGSLLVDGVLVLQPTAGQFTAFNATCPHQGATVSPAQNGVITCWAHMSRFRATDGARAGGPAQRGLAKVAISVQGDTIFRGRNP